MSTTLHRWRGWRAIIARICPHAAIVAAAPLFAAAFLIDQRYMEPLSMLGLLAGGGGFLALSNRNTGRVVVARTAEVSDGLMMRLSAASAEAIRVYLEPDSQWRLNLIKEIADNINDDNAIALAAIEGTVLDLGQKLAAVQAELDQLRRGD